MDVHKTFSNALYIKDIWQYYHKKGHPDKLCICKIWELERIQLQNKLEWVKKLASQAAVGEGFYKVIPKGSPRNGKSLLAGSRDSSHTSGFVLSPFVPKTRMCSLNDHASATKAPLVLGDQVGPSDSKNRVNPGNVPKEKSRTKGVSPQSEEEDHVSDHLVCKKNVRTPVLGNNKHTLTEKTDQTRRVEGDVRLHYKADKNTVWRVHEQIPSDVSNLVKREGSV